MVARIKIILLSLSLTGCITQKEVVDSYSKGGHPKGKSEWKNKR
jgi:hypothetical protein